MKSKIFIAILLILAILLAIFIFLSRKNENLGSLENLTRNLINTEGQKENISLGKELDFPTALPSGFSIRIFAGGLNSPRDMVFSPGGTLLVTNPGGNNVYALPDKNNDGVSDENKIIISNLTNAHGLAFYGNYLYVASTDKVTRFNWDEKNLTATQDKILFSLTSNFNHNKRTIVFNKNGQMFVSIGSSCNVCTEEAKDGGSVLISDAEGTTPRVFATGLRNAAFLAINPDTQELWATEMGRDNLGDDLPPDEINILREGQNYGWPYCYGMAVRDSRFDPSNSASCQGTTSPIFEIPAHSAPLGLTFIDSPKFPASWQGDLLVAYHGSWNRSVPTGYKVVRLNVNGNLITGSEDFLTGFSPASIISSTKGRPVDLVFDNSGNLFLSDDKEGKIYIIESK